MCEVAANSGTSDDDTELLPKFVKSRYLTSGYTSTTRDVEMEKKFIRDPAEKWKKTSKRVCDGQVWVFREKTRFWLVSSGEAQDIAL